MEPIHESPQQVALRQQRVDREAHVQSCLQLLQASAQNLRVLGKFDTGESEQVRHRYGDQDAVHGTAWPCTTQKLQEVLPRLAVGDTVAVMRRVPPRSVDEYGLIR